MEIRASQPSYNRLIADVPSISTVIGDEEPIQAIGGSRLFWGGVVTPAEDRQPRRAALIAATSIFFMPIIASNARFASSPPAASASVSTRGVICQDTPHLSLHQPHALS